MDGLTCSEGCELAKGHAGPCGLLPTAGCYARIEPRRTERKPPVRKHKIAAARRRLVDLLQSSADAPVFSALQRELAYEGACSIITSHCCARERGKGWWDLESVDDYAENDVRKAAQYLTLRGLLEPHSVNHSWVRLREEKTPEVTA